MNSLIRFASTIAFSATLVACMDSPPDFGAFPSADEDVTAVVTKEQATATGQVALEGLDTFDFDRWSVSWSSGLRGAINASVWRPYAEGLKGEYGDFIEIDETRITAAEDPSAVRFSFLAEFERGYLMLVHVYPSDGEEIVGVHIRDAITGEVPESLR